MMDKETELERTKGTIEKAKLKKLHGEEEGLETDVERANGFQRKGDGIGMADKESAECIHLWVKESHWKDKGIIRAQEGFQQQQLRETGEHL